MLYNDFRWVSWTVARLYASLLQNQKLGLIKVASSFVRLQAAAIFAAPLCRPFQSLTHFQVILFRY